MQDYSDYNTFDDPDQPFLRRKMIRARLHCAVLVLALLCLLLTVALVIVVLINQGPTEFRAGDSPQGQWISQLLFADVQFDKSRQDELRSALFAKVTPRNMMADWRVLAQHVHVAGTPQNDKIGDFIAQRYESLGYTVTETTYKVMLTYPDYQHPNTLYATDPDTGIQQLISNGKGQPLGPPEAQQYQTDPEAPVWWNGYAKNGSATGKIVYANYGRITDYQALDALGVDLTGALVLCRYGKLWRGSKVQEAVKRGAVGVIIYSDPADYAPQGDKTFPDSIQMPPNGAQRGSTLMGNGDPLTPLYPSKSYVRRTKTERDLREANVLPNVPVMPVSYKVAQEIFSRLDDVEAPAEFEGGLPTPYYLTGNTTFTMNVHSISDTQRRIRNICSHVTGRIYPDRLVIMSNHYDAWTNGVLDPGSGTTVMMEAARAISEVMKEKDWRPKRTIMFCHWDAEEYGLVGSREWIEEHAQLLGARAVAVINIDIAVAGNVTLTPQGTPSLLGALLHATQQVSNPNPNEVEEGRLNVYDSWHFWFPQGTKKSMPGLQPPILEYPGSSSDHYTFSAFLGIPVIKMGYSCAPKECNYLYHTMYEVPWTLENLFDRGYETHAALAKVTLDLARQLSDHLIVPFQLNDYVEFLRQEIKQLDADMKSDGLQNVISDYGSIISNLTDAITRLGVAVDNLQQVVTDISSNEDTTNLLQVDMLNERLTQFERCWLNPMGLYPERADTRHVVLSSSIHDNYQGMAFASVRDPIEYYMNAQAAHDETTANKWLNQVIQSLVQVQYSMESAILMLSIDDQLWSRPSEEL